MTTINQMPNFAKAAAQGANKRKGLRYPIGPTFLLKAALALVDQNARTSHGTAKPSFKPKGHIWKDWPGTLVDLSATGANIHVNLAAVAFPEDPCRLKLSLGSYKLEVPCTVAHFLCYSQYANCGVQFNFPDAEAERSYFQVLDPVIFGTSLAPLEVAPESTGRHKEQYAGKNSSMLTVWRRAPGAELTGFDFRMKRYGVRWNAGLTELATYGVEADRSSGSRAAVKPALKLKLKSTERTEDSTSTTLTEAQDEEVRWLFCLAVSNLSPLVAEDVRKFLLSLVVA